MKTLNKKLVTEATDLLEQWARKHKLIREGRRLCTTFWFEEIPCVHVLARKPSPARVDQILSMPFKNLELSTRTRNGIINSGIELIGDLVRCRKEELQKLGKFGFKSMNEIEAKLAAIGLMLGMTLPMGPREREIVMRGRVGRVCDWKAADALAHHGFRTINELTNMKSEEIRSMLASDREIGVLTSGLYIAEMVDKLGRRGLAFAI